MRTREVSGELFSRELLRDAILIALALNHLRHIGEAFAALRTLAAAFEDLAHGACLMARAGEFFVFQRIADAHIHETATILARFELPKLRAHTNLDGAIDNDCQLQKYESAA